MYFVNQGIHILAIPVYQMNLGVDPFLLGLAMTLPMVLAANFGPWVGHRSDTFQSSMGRRRPFILISAWLLAISYGCIWMVSPEWNTAIQLIYFSFWCCLFYFFALFFTLPLTSLAYECSDDSGIREQALGFTAYFLKLGSLLYQWIYPLSQAAIFSSVFVGIRTVGWGLGLLVFGVLGSLPALFCKERSLTLHNASLPTQSWLKKLAVIRDNRSFALVLLLLISQMGGTALSATMDYYLLVYFMAFGDIAEGATAKALLSSAYALASIVWVPIILWGASKFGKLKTLEWICILNFLGGLLKFVLYRPEQGYWFLFDAVLCSAIWSAMVVIVPALISDISHRDSLESKQNQTGLFVAVHTWVLTMCTVAVLLLSGLSLNMMGFDATLGPAQSDSSIMLMRVMLALGTTLSSALGLVFVRKLMQRQYLDFGGNSNSGHH